MSDRLREWKYQRLGPIKRAAIYLAVLVNLRGKFAERMYQKRSKKDLLILILSLIFIDF